MTTVKMSSCLLTAKKKQISDFGNSAKFAAAFGGVIKSEDSDTCFSYTIDEKSNEKSDEKNNEKSDEKNNEKDDEKGGGSLSNGAIIGIAVAIVVFIIIVMIIIAITVVKVMGKKNDKHEGNDVAEMSSFKSSRTVDNTDNTITTTTNVSQSLLAVMTDLYPPGYARPDMKYALMKAGLTEDDAEKVKEACYARQAT